METVTIGCKLPSGLIIEVGYQVERKGSSGKMHASVKRLPGYQRYTLKGSNSLNDQKIQLPAGLSRVYLNEGVPKDLWDEWKKLHADSPYLKNGVLFEASDVASARTMARDVAKVDNGFEPLDPNKTTVPGISKAVFDDKAA